MTRFKIMLVAGILLLGFYGFTASYVPSADPAAEEACRAEITRRGGALTSDIDRCRERAFAAVMTARDARSAALGASSANQMETLTHMASMFALGLGAVLTLAGALGCLGILKPRRAG